MSSRTVDQVLDEALVIHRRYQAMDWVVQVRTAHGEGDGPAARAARHMVHQLGARHALLVEEAVALFNRDHSDLPVTQDGP